jgi:DNA-binding TFAR19-related protein (PDSD5 family)
MGLSRDQEVSAVLEEILTPQARARRASIEVQHPERKDMIEKRLMALATSAQRTRRRE